MTQYSYDIIIVGSGIVGASLALALSQKTKLQIALLEEKNQQFSWDKSQYHHRVSAISLASKRFFSALNIWQSIADKRISPFSQIEIWTDKNAMNFNSQSIGKNGLGFIIENDLIQSELMRAVFETSQIQYFAPIELQALQRSIDHDAKISSDFFVNELITNQGVFKANLIIAADGANSWIRKAAKMDVNQHDYFEKALVATVETELPHHEIARQKFLATGPLAFLPLASSHLASIVWTLPQQEADEILALSDEIFKLKLSEAFDHRLGKILHADKRYAFSLVRRESARYIAPQLALVGDAAHSIHPMAGLGVNMGLLDVANLVDTIVAAIKNDKPYFNLQTLRKYERQRKADHLPLMLGLEFIKKIFASQHPVAKNLLSQGLKTTNHFQFIKNFFIRYATFDRADLPTLMQ